jgi:hypothetical protein
MGTIIISTIKSLYLLAKTIIKNFHIKPMPLVELLSSLINQKKIIPVIGAGVSAASAGVPGWWGLIKTGLDFAKDRGLSNDDLYKSTEEKLEKNDLLGAAKELKLLLKAPGGVYGSWLDSQFDGLKVKNEELYNSILKLDASYLITTNYDKLLSEHHLYRENFTWEEPELVRKNITQEKPFVFHIHGVYTHPQTLIFGGDDYDAIKLNAAYRALINFIWLGKSLLFIGCSKDGVLDEDFKLTIQTFTDAFTDSAHEHYILLKSADADSKSIKDFLHKYRIQIIVFGDRNDQLPVFIDSFNPNENLNRIKLNTYKFLEKCIADISAGKEVQIALKDEWRPDSAAVLRDLFDKRQEFSTNKRNELRAIQSLVASFIAVKELAEAASWVSETPGDKERLAKLPIIERAIKADQLLRTFPDDVLKRINRKNRSIIHPYWFTGELTRYINTYVLLKQQDKADHFGDRYDYENLTRIMTSLEKLLLVDSKEIYPELLPKVSLLPAPVEHGILLVVGSEISIRNPKIFENKLASIAAEDSLEFEQANLVSFRGRRIVVGHNKEVAFTWDPMKDSFIKPYHTLTTESEIHESGYDFDKDGKLICWVLAGGQFRTFVNFKEEQIISLPNSYQSFTLLDTASRVAFLSRNKIMLRELTKDKYLATPNADEILQQLLKDPFFKMYFEQKVDEIKKDDDFLNDELKKEPLVLDFDALKTLLIEGQEFLCSRANIKSKFSRHFSVILFFEDSGSGLMLQGYFLQKDSWLFDFEIKNDLLITAVSYDHKSTGNRSPVPLV